HGPAAQHDGQGAEERAARPLRGLAGRPVRIEPPLNKMQDETGRSSAATKIAAAALAAVALVSLYDSAPAQPAATEASPKPPSAMGETAAFAPAAARDAASASASAQNEQAIPGLELDVWAPPGLVA